MFEDLINVLAGLDGQTLSVPIESDEKGYIDRQCPSSNCRFLFKVNEKDWKKVEEDNVAWCPFCRHEAAAEQWFTADQIEHAEAEVMAIVEAKLGNALLADAQKFNRSQPRAGFISMSMEVSGISTRMHIVPAAAAEAMQLEIQCEKCNCRFAVIGSAYFCPSCGFNSVTRTFLDSLRKIKVKKDNISTIRVSLTKAVGKDDAELTCRSLIETCISDGVVAFQKYCEGMYIPFGTPPFNAFQRLDQSSELWFQAVQKRFSDWLTTSELSRLKTLFQKRHILAHNEGIVDSKYILNSGDNSYREGQRIVVTELDIEALTSALEKLGTGIKESVGTSS